MEQEIDRCQETRVMGISFRGPIIHETWYLPDASLGIWRASGLNEAREEEGEAAGAVETSRQKQSTVFPGNCLQTRLRTTKRSRLHYFPSR